jgi:hypothetical protein
LLDWYIQDAQSLLRDQAGLFTPVSQLTRWINLGRREVAKRTGCLRRLITGQSGFGASMQPGAITPGAGQPGALPDSFPDANLNANASQNSFMSVPGVERYPYDFANPFLKAQYQGIKGITDVISVSVSWGGSVRPSLDWMPWDVLQARARAFATLVTSYPYWWSTFDDGENGELWFFPVPSFAMEMEWDTMTIPLDLSNDTDYDAIPDGFKNAIKFYAVAMSHMGAKRYMEASLHLNMFADAIGVARFAADMGKTRSYYPTMFG